MGIHCYKHDYGLIYNSENNYFQDFLAAQEVVFEYTGTYATAVRFPGGSRTAFMLGCKYKGGFPEFMELMHGMGVRCYDWSIQPEIAKSSYDVTYSFTHPAAAYDGDICLQHDIRPYSVHALEDMIRWALEEGYTFLPVDVTTPEILFEMK